MKVFAAASDSEKLKNVFFTYRETVDGGGEGGGKNIPPTPMTYTPKPLNLYSKPPKLNCKPPKLYCKPQSQTPNPRTPITLQPNP